jgi:hypothetical protein
MAISTASEYVSSLETWITTIELYDDNDNSAINLSAVEDIIVSLRDPETKKTVLTASLDTGEIVLSLDNLSAVLTVPRSRMSALDAKTYEIGLRVIWTANTNERQYILGTMAVVEGL